MTQNTKDILKRVATWPRKDQEELAELARQIEARRTGLYKLSPEERERIDESLLDLEAGRFASDDRIASIFKKARASRR